MPNKFLADNAANVLENNKKEQEVRKQVIFRNLKMQELQQLETQLFYKKQEVIRIKTAAERLRREAVGKQNNEIKEKHELMSQKRQLEDTEKRIKELDHDVSASLSDIQAKIIREKNLISEHEKVLGDLEMEKEKIEGTQVSKIRSLKESLSRILFFKKKVEHDAQQAHQIFDTNQRSLAQFEYSLKVYSQEVTVLENKVRTLKSALR